MGMGPAVVVGPQPVYYNSGPSLFTIIGFVLFAVVGAPLNHFLSRHSCISFPVEPSPPRVPAFESAASPLPGPHVL